MRLSCPTIALGLLLLASTALSQNVTTAPAGQVLTHVIQVSGKDGGLKFYPAEISGVNPGDLVQFHFYPKSHSVAQSSFDAPCQSKGFWSGMMPVTAASTIMPVFSIVVNDTKPIWFYCATGKHCQAGMSGVINPPLNKTLAEYQTAAALVPQTGVPGSVSGGIEGNSTGTAPNTTISTSSPTSSLQGTGASAGNTVRVWGRMLGAMVAVAAGCLVAL